MNNNNVGHNGCIYHTIIVQGINMAQDTHGDHPITDSLRLMHHSWDKLIDEHWLRYHEK